VPQYVCNLCDKSFSVRQDIVDRYDSWTPSQCLDCRNRIATPSASSGTSRKSTSGKRSRSRTSSTSLSVAQVLEEFTGGPDTGVFTDGSSIPNPGPGGWGAVYVVAGEILDEAYGHDPATTNNRMELTALIEGIRLVPENQPTTIYSDSNLCVQTVNTWAAGWERNGWKRKSGPIKNLDLVQELYALAKSRPELTFTWIRAHDGSLWNEYADALSTAWNRSEL
jgi:ribonuclease HI